MLIKFNINNQEYPAIVVVLKQEWQDRIGEVLEYISNIDVPGCEHLIGTRFVDKFKTNPITAKRDYLSLSDERTGYYRFDNKNNAFYQIDLDLDNKPIISSIEKEELKVHEIDTPKVLVKR